MPGELFETDGPVLTVGQLDAVTRVPLIQDVLGRDEGGDKTRACVVRARTPHGSHVFDVVSLEWTDDDELMFNLREKV